MIAPYLEKILESIITPTNASSMTHDQWALFKTQFDGFMMKLQRLGVIFEPHTNDKTPLSKESKLYYLRLAKDAIDSLRNDLSRDYCESMLIGSFLDREVVLDESVKELVDMCQKEMETFEIFPRVPVSGFSSDNIMRNNSVRLIEDGLLGLSRSHPRRVIAPSGSVLLRDISPFVLYAHESEDIEELMLQYAHYELEVVNECKSDGTATIEFHPKGSHFTEEIAQLLYGRSLENLTMYSLFQNKERLEDRNFNRLAIFSKIVGTSMTAIDHSLELLCIIAGSLISSRTAYRENALVNFRKRFIDYGIGDIFDLVNPSGLQQLIENKVPIQTLTDCHETIMRELEAVRDGILYGDMFKAELSSLYFQNEKESIIFTYPTPSAPSPEVSFK